MEKEPAGNGDDPGPIETETIMKGPPAPESDEQDQTDPGRIETHRLWEGQRDDERDE